MADQPLRNLRTLRDNMRRRAWVITCFRFDYNDRQYVVIVERYVAPRVQPEYALVELRFVDRADQGRTLEVPANTSRLMTDARTLREYFHIRWVDNLGDILQQFADQFGQVVPTSLPVELPSGDRAVVLTQLSTADGDDPRKIYCTHVRRNPNHADGSPGMRSAFNSQKTEILRPDLYRQLSGDAGLSFCFSLDRQLERSDAAILELLSERQGIGRAGHQRPRRHPA